MSLIDDHQISIHTSITADFGAVTTTVLAVAAGQQAFISFYRMDAPTGSCEIRFGSTVALETIGTGVSESNCVIIGADGADVVVATVGATTDKNVTITCGLIDLQELSVTNTIES